MTWTVEEYELRFQEKLKEYLDNLEEKLSMVKIWNLGGGDDGPEQILSDWIGGGKAMDADAWACNYHSLVRDPYEKGQSIKGSFALGRQAFIYCMARDKSPQDAFMWALAN